RGARHRRGADRHRHRAVCRHPGGDRLQPLRQQGRTPGDALRNLHGRVRERAPAPGVRGTRLTTMDSYSRRRRRLMSEINVVPYIDVMLVLLIIFMITAPLLTQGVQIDLPRASARPIDTQDRETLVVAIARDGRYYLDDKVVTPEA